MTDIINSPNGGRNDSTAWILGIIVIVLIILFFVFLLPSLRNGDTTGTPTDTTQGTDQNGNTIVIPPAVTNTVNSTTTVTSTTTDND